MTATFRLASRVLLLWVNGFGRFNELSISLDLLLLIRALSTLRRLLDSGNAIPTVGHRGYFDLRIWILHSSFAGSPDLLKLGES